MKTWVLSWMTFGNSLMEQLSEIYMTMTYFTTFIIQVLFAGAKLEKSL